MLEGSIHQLPNMNISHGPQTDSGDSVEQILRPPPTLATEYIDRSDGALIWLAFAKISQKVHTTAQGTTSISRRGVSSDPIGTSFNNNGL